MKYRIRDIENFIATSGCKSIVEAARLLEIGQPSLSESIKRLEQDCGSILFYRSRSGIQLTPVGRTFRSRAQKATDALNELEASEENGPTNWTSQISIGCHPTVAQYTVPKALAYLKKHSPEYKISLRHDLSRIIQSEVQRGLIDVGVVINPAEVPDLIIRSLGTDTFSVWSSSARASELDTIICNPDLFQTQSILKKWKAKPAKIISTDSLDLICRLVSENIGFGILPERAVGLSKLELRQMKLLPTFEDKICLIYRPEFGKSMQGKTVIEALKQSMR